MEPNSQWPAREEEKHKVVAFPMLGAARPKRRWKKMSGENVSSPAERVIVPIPSTTGRPVKFTRSGRPLQVWKAPRIDAAQPEPEKPSPAVLFKEFLAFYMRTILAQSRTRFRLAP